MLRSHKPGKKQVNKGQNKNKIKADVGESLSEARAAKGGADVKRKRKSITSGLKGT